MVWSDIPKHYYNVVKYNIMKLSLTLFCDVMDDKSNKLA